jgi:hypothetical protein
MVNDKAPQSSNAAHIRFMRPTLLLYRTSNLFAHGVFSRQQKAPADSDAGHLFRRDAGRLPERSPARESDGF